MAKPKAPTVEVENVNHPGRVGRADAAKYAAMKDAILTVLPDSAPGITLDELRGPVVDRLPENLFPGGATARWWLKTVQLDLEAKGLAVRTKTSPIRLHKT
jgi:uncharacterized protein DUF6958